MRKKQHRLFSKALCLVGLFFVFFGAVDTNLTLAQGHGPVGDGTILPNTNPTGGNTTNITGVTGSEDASGNGHNSTASSDQLNENAAVADNLGQIDDPILRVLHKIVVQGLGSLVGLFGSAFDWAITNMIVGFGDQYLKFNIGYTIEQLWSTVRDIFNLTFIFGLVYIGFKMILDSSDHHARKMLISLIGAALLVNFSLFITKFVVDFSNIAATQIYNSFETKDAGDTLSITNGFMSTMGINTILNVDYGNSASIGYNYIIGLTLVFLVLAYVFLAGALMIIVRFALLCIYLVFSPVMFLGWVFPSMKNHSQHYWQGFLSQAFFAPAFLFMLYLSYRVATDYKFNQQELGHMFKNDGTIETVAAIIPYFAMVIVFLVTSMVVAKSMGGRGASFAMSVSNKIAGGATVGLAARAGRTVIGGSAYALAKNKSFQGKMNSNFVGRGILKATNKVADSSFDARQIGGVGKKFGVGDGKKGGFTTRLKESKEADEKYLKLLSTYTADDDKVVIAQKQKIAHLEQSRNFLTGVHRENNEKDIIQAKAELEELKKSFGVEREYANHLSYIKSKDDWNNAWSTAVAAGAGIGVGILSGGIIPAAIAAGVAGVGNRYHTNQDVGALKKAYGDDGSKMKKSKAQKEALEELAKAVKEEAGGHKAPAASGKAPEKAHKTPTPTHEPSGEAHAY